MPIPVSARSKEWVCDCSLVRIVGSNPAGGMDVCFECCVLTERSLCVGLITRLDESYQEWCVNVIVKLRKMRRPWPTGGCCAMEKKNVNSKMG